MKATREAVTAFVKFIAARERHRVAKESGRKVDKPDAIISQYRFCNARRNDDRVTKWIFENYLDPWREEPHLWFALVVARLFNNEDTLDSIKKGLLPFKPEYLRATLHYRARKMGLKNFNAAYIVSTNGLSMDKVDYVIDIVLKPLWADRAKITKKINVGQLANVHPVFSEYRGLGSFMAAQVIADLKYANPKRWEDFGTFAASGPGSRRGLNRVLGLAPDRPWKEVEWRASLATLRDAVNARLSWEPLTAHDIQNCLCEYDKYERVRLGEGRPKQLYKPKEA